MTTLGGDHSTAGAIIGGSLRRAGLGGGIVRYACEGRGDVNITAGEVRDLNANRIPIGIVCEHEANWLLRGGVAGRIRGCRAITRAVGLPDGVVYCAADLDITEGGPTSPGSPGDRNMNACLAALHQAAAVIGQRNVGFYGSYFAIDWLLHRAPWIRWFWQTEAWSHGRRHPAACLYQRAESMNVHGVDVDVDEIWKPSWGQRGGIDRPPHPGPAGTFAAHLAVNDRGHWSAHGVAGAGVALGGADEWWQAKVGVNRRRGTWRVSPLPAARKGARAALTVHPKVAAATVTGAAVTGAQAILHALTGWSPTPAEASAIGVAAASLAGYLKSAGILS